MSNLAISAVQLAKLYRIGGPRRAYDRLGDRLVDGLLAPARRLSRVLRGDSRSAADLEEEIWALKEVSFEVEHGEVVGVIGRNGAGKTTLLKLLSRITVPTTGYADLYGRVGSLLEVGTGFHPELTGRENVYLNGAILGMSRPEIASRFDQIVEFAGIEKFIETPVKHYSSGMYVRLAFSVAAHLDPDILLIDEVLAVGDMAFQQKCLERMGEVAGGGRTVLFVSHNMALVERVCTRGIYIEEGRIVFDGTIQMAISEYLASLSGPAVSDLSTRTDREGLGQVRLTMVEVNRPNSETDHILRAGSPARISIHVDQMIPGLDCAISIYDHMGAPVSVLRSKFRSPSDEVYVAGNGTVPVLTCDIDELPLLPGRYRMDVAILGDDRMQDFVRSASAFDVVEGNLRGRPMLSDKRFRVQMPHHWTIPRE